MAFAAVTPISAIDGSLLTIDAAAVDGALSFTSRISVPTMTARVQFGNVNTWINRAVQQAGLSMEGSITGYVSQTIFASLWTKITAGADVALTLQDETGAGKDVYSGNFILSELSRTNAAEGYVEFSCSFQSNGTITKSPQLVLTPAAGALAAQVGVSATVATFQCTGGAAAYAYTCTGLGASALSLNSSSGVLNGTPAANMQGVYNLKVTATDDNDVAITQEYVLTIAAA